MELEDLRDPQVKRLLGWLMERWRQGTLPQDHRSLVNSLPRDSGDWENRIARWLAWADSVVEKNRVLEEVLQRIQKEKQKASLESLKALIRQAEESGDEATTYRLIGEYNRLLKAPAGALY